MNIGILLPRSDAHANIGIDFLAGLKTLFAAERLQDEIQIFTESVGFGGVEKAVYENAEKLLVIEDVDILIAFIDLNVIKVLEPLLAATNKLMIVVNPGANFPQNWIPQPGIIYLTLQQAFNCWLTGKYAATQSEGKNALMATSFYDCGYRHSEAMVSNFVRNEGVITFNYIHDQKASEDFNIDRLKIFLEEDSDTDKLLCIFDSKPAGLLYKSINEHKEASQLSLFASPMMLEKTAIDFPQTSFKFSIDGYLPWHADIQNDANASFIKSYENAKKKMPGIFSLLGWEAGIILQRLLAESVHTGYDASEQVSVLKAASIESPRGEMKLDDETHFILTPTYLASLPAGSETLLINQQDDWYEEWAFFSTRPPEKIISGWTNTYLCY